MYIIVGNIDGVSSIYMLVDQSSTEYFRDDRNLVNRSRGNLGRATRMKKTTIMLVIALVLFVLVIVIAANSNKSDNSEIMSPSPLPTVSGTPSSDPTPEQASGAEASPPETPEIPVSPSQQNMPPDWQYDIKKDGLYRTDLNTGNIMKINDQDYASGIIISDDWLYFCDNGLYRMDNENKRELITDEECGCLSLNGGWLYYINNDGIIRIKTDGSERELMLQCQCTWMAIADQYVFYVLEVPVNDEDWHEDGPPLPLGELHRIDLSGNNDVNIGVLVTNLNVFKNTLYFSDSEDNYFYSMNPDTLEKTAAYKGYFIVGPCFGGDYCFFESDHKLYKLDLTDGETTVVKEDLGFRTFGVFDGYVYFNEYGNENALYKMRIDGIEPEKVEDLIIG